jgi:hypothetical protein
MANHKSDQLLATAGSGWLPTRRGSSAQERRSVQESGM